jgi:hypothetical protein
MMPFKNRTTQIIELLPTFNTLMPLAMRLMIMKTTFLYLGRSALRASNPIRPAQCAHYRKTLGIIYQILYVDHEPILSESDHLLEFS